VSGELILPHRKSVSEYVFDVSPDPGKVGQDLFQAMLDDLWKYDPTLVIGAEPATSAERCRHGKPVAWIEARLSRSVGSRPWWQR